MKQNTKLKLQKTDFYFGNLKEIIIDRMLVFQSLKDTFSKISEKNKNKFNQKYLKDFESMFGFKPGKEILEWENLKKAYRSIMYEVSDVWNMIDHHSAEEDEMEEDEDGGFDYSISSTERLVKIQDPDEILSWLVGTYSGLMFFFNGSYTFASDGGGDTCWLNLLPNENESVEVNRYNHEIGELESLPYFSISHFIADNWTNDTNESYDDEDEEEFEEENPDKKEKEPILVSEIKESLIKAFEKEATKFYENKPIYNNSLDMFERSAWLLGHTYGEPAYAFTEKLADAPSYTIWEEEKVEIKNYPNLAAYWILHHFYLKNEEACRETIKLASKCKGKVIPLLSKHLLSYLDGQSKTLFNLSSEKVEKIRTQTFSNADPKQIEPKNAQLYNDSLGFSNLKTISKKELETRLKSDSDLFQLIEEYPDDVLTHDTILKEISKKDPNLKKLIEDYFRERTDSAYNTWPYNPEKLDKRLSVVINAAFRQGLKYDADNKKAFCGITKTIGMLNDDGAMISLREAVHKLKQDDPRMEYVVEALIQSDHKESRSILADAAWRAFETLDNVKEINQKVQKEGPTLNNMFTVYTHLNEALQERILTLDEVSVELIQKLFTYRDHFKYFGMSVGNAFAVCAHLGLNEHIGIIAEYLRKSFQIKGRDRGSYLELRLIINISEAAIAWAKMEPEKAKQELSKFFNEVDELNDPGVSIDLKACYLAGLLFLESDNEEYTKFAERILGNKGDQVRVYGIIRCIKKRKLYKFKEYLWYHIYADPDPMVDYSWSYVEVEARSAWETLTGAEAPEFDGSDKYASSLAKNKSMLPLAILHPEKYSIQHVFEKIRETKYKHDDVVRYGGPWLVESLRYSLDEYKYSGSYDRWEAIKALFFQGRSVFPHFIEILKLPYAAPSWKAYLLQFMRVMEPESMKWNQVLKMNSTEIKTQLENPSPDWYVWTDLLAAKLFLLDGESSFETISQVIVNRLDMTNHESYDSSIYEESLGLRLPLLWRWYGKQGDDRIQKHWKETKSSSETRTMLDMAARRKLENQIPTMPKIEEPGILLTFYPEQREYGWHTWIHMTPNVVRFGTNEFHLHSVLADSKTESSIADAKEHLEMIWKMAFTLGYTVSKKKPKGKK
ncbi:hypothetical protein EHQ68_17510 [Leptospira congkakensis]|uniref:Uncharacterized protein n=1 Tax=Leptospira congkakensis TaxID=2484932 RepID=A0A4Z1AN66_9LEPT|nr:hypothetical protein [Leptospira congkakensis]TGL85242.1 hypothetical protein EHQ68_17510 [Leptospira congkakensis]TGL85367.1 hypothetical protein EHQ69_18575 [Leptospira congkakensis]TGL99889.1 hypothetical protein EHQ70_00830 [Leptospira congkakensis]